MLHPCFPLGRCLSIHNFSRAASSFGTSLESRPLAPRHKTDSPTDVEDFTKLIDICGDLLPITDHLLEVLQHPSLAPRVQVCVCVWAA